MEKQEANENQRVKEARNAAEYGIGRHTDLNIHCRMSEEQRQARKESFIAGLKQNMFKLEQRARIV